MISQELIEIPWYHPDPSFELKKATKGSVGYDLQYHPKDPYDLISLDSCVTKVNTGLCINLALTMNGAEVRSRSSLSIENILVIQGTIDRDYTGEICALMYLVPFDFPYWEEEKVTKREVKEMVLLPYSRVAQLVISEPHKLVRKTLQEFYRFKEDNFFEERGEKGFGSTGN